MLSKKSFEELYGKYRKHPKAVQSGFDGLPILTPGKFYMIIHQNEDRHGYTGVQLWKCICEPTFHGEYKVSYGMNTLSDAKAGCMYTGFIYKWFNKGNNCILELPEDQQKAFSALWESIGSQAGCKYSWDLNAEFPEVWDL